MDPWQPVNCNGSNDHLSKTDHVTLTAVFPECPVRKTIDSAQYLSIIGKPERYFGKMQGCGMRAWQRVKCGIQVRGDG